MAYITISSIEFEKKNKMGKLTKNCGWKAKLQVTNIDILTKVFHQQ